MGKCIVDSTSTCDVRTINLLFHYWLEMEIDLIWFQSLFKQAHWYCDSNIYLLLVAICITLVFGLDLRNPIIVRYPFVFYTKSMACGKNAFQCNLMSKVFWRILERVSKWKTLPKEREIGRQRDRETERDWVSINNWGKHSRDRMADYLPEECYRHLGGWQKLIIKSYSYQWVLPLRVLILLGKAVSSDLISFLSFSLWLPSFLMFLFRIF